MLILTDRFLRYNLCDGFCFFGSFETVSVFVLLLFLDKRFNLRIHSWRHCLSIFLNFFLLLLKSGLLVLS